MFGRHPAGADKAGDVFDRCREAFCEHQGEEDAGGEGTEQQQVRVHGHLRAEKGLAEAGCELQDWRVVRAGIQALQP